MWKPKFRGAHVPTVRLLPPRLSAVGGPGGLDAERDPGGGGRGGPSPGLLSVSTRPRGYSRSLGPQRPTPSSQSAAALRLCPRPLQSEGAAPAAWVVVEPFRPPTPAPILALQEWGFQVELIESFLGILHPTPTPTPIIDSACVEEERRAVSST